MRRMDITQRQQLDYAVGEAMNTLCTNLMFSGSSIRKIMITSCQASEGKSFISFHVALKMSELGKRVAIIDTDLRRSVMCARFGIRFPGGNEKGVGLTHYLSGQCKLEDAIYTTNVDNLLIVPVGRRVSNSLSLLNDRSFSTMLEKLKELVDYVIVDAPPVGMVIDAAEIAKSCDGTLFVVKYNEIRRKDMIEAKAQIVRSGCQVLGAVLNEVSFKSYSSRKYYNKSYYSYKYAKQEEPTK